MECPRSCRRGKTCTNNGLTNQVARRIEVRPAGAKGRGVFALEDIPPGALIVEFVGEVLTTKTFHPRKNGPSSRFAMRIPGGVYIDPTFTGNDARLINHSCSPNAEAQPWLVEGLDRIAIRALSLITCGAERAMWV